MGAVDSYEIHGSPDPEEQQAILAALEAALAGGGTRAARSRWTLASRAQSVRAWMPARNGWTAAARLGPRTPAPQFRRGRGDCC